MADYYLKSGNNADWAALAVKVSGDRVVASRAATAARKVRVFECTTGGTTGAAEPAWNTTVGGTTSDGSVTWTTREPTTWANAHRYLDHMTHNVSSGAVVAGDRVFVSNSHAESFAGNSLLVEDIGTKDNPYYVLCVSDDTVEPPTTLATGATISTTGASTYRIRGHSCYIYGIEYRLSVGAGGAGNFQADGQGNLTLWQRFENCIIDLQGSSGTISIGETTGSAGAGGRSAEQYFINCELQFTQAANALSIQSGQFTWLGGSITGTAPTTLLNLPNGQIRKVLIDGVDLSLAATNLLGLSSANNAGQFADEIVVRNCKIHASVVGISHLPAGTGTVIKVINCSSGSETYKYKSKNYYGDVDHEITFVRTGGASDGVTPLSWKLVTNANSKRAQPIYSPWFAIWNDATGSAKTVDVEILRDSATNLKDNEIWLEVLYLGDSGSPKTTLITDASNVLAAGADQAGSSATWTTTGMGNPNKQKLSVTFTPQLKGLIRARVALARASATVYADPLLVIS